MFLLSSRLAEEGERGKEKRVIRTEDLEISLPRIELVEDDVVLDGDSRSRVSEVGIVGGDDSESISLRLPGEGGDGV